VEHNLATYVAIVTVINGALGTIVQRGPGCSAFEPADPGILAMALNYIPYVGPACMAIILFAVGFVNFSSLGQAFIAPASLIVLTTIEATSSPRPCSGAVSPSIRSRSFSAIAFWTWLWGPMGAFLAVPLLVVALVIVGHVFPSTTSSCPDDRELFSASMVVLQTDFPRASRGQETTLNVEHVQHGSRHGR